VTPVIRFSVGTRRRDDRLLDSTPGSGDPDLPLDRSNLPAGICPQASDGPPGHLVPAPPARVASASGTSSPGAPSEGTVRAGSSSTPSVRCGKRTTYGSSSFWWSCGRPSPSFSGPCSRRIAVAVGRLDAAKIGGPYRPKIVCFGDMGGHKGFYIHSDTWFGGHTSVFKMGGAPWAMKMAFKEMYFRSGGKPVSWGMPATELAMDHLLLP
jgi:hypothetical protein